MKAVIYHNPKCSKSRQTLQLLEAHGAEIEIVDYQKTPISKETIDVICKGLSLEPQQLIRTKEQLFKDLGLSLNDDKSREDWIEILHQYPRLMERPIVRMNQNFVIGRPPENVEILFENI